jgi:hypothetical protein
VGVPLIAGAVTAVGAVPDETTAVGAEVAIPDPAEFDAVTATRTVAPASAAATP